MTTKTDDITLPPFPDTIAKLPIDGDGNGPLIWKDDEVRAYARAAVDADRQGRVPSDEEIEACGSDGPMSLKVALDFADNPRPCGSLAAPADTNDELYEALRVLAAEYRALLSRYGSSQPAASPEGSPAIRIGFGTFSPDDRFWHATDRTWWRRGDDGMLVRAEAPQTAAGAEPCKDMVPVRREAVDWLKKHYPALCEKSGLCERVAGRLYTRTSLAASAAPVAQEPVAYLACDPETGEPVWGEDCVCKDNVYSPEDTGTIGRPVVFAPVAVRPIDMILRCPTCGTQHIDASDGDWTNPPHRSHLCATCGHIWRPADVATNGVAAIKTKGQNDSAPVAAQAQPSTGVKK